MIRFTSLAAAAALVVAVFAGRADAAPDTRGLLAHADATVTDLRTDAVFGNARRTLRDARAILIVPSLVKGGFIFGGEGGNGVLLARTRHGWSDPAFYTLASASFGLQIGLEQSQLVMFIMSDRALRGIEQGKVKLGAGAGLTVVTLGASAEGATPANLAGDIIVWAKSKGAYGGLTLNGSVVAPDDDTNAAFYGQPTPAKAILAGDAHNPEAAPLRVNLKNTW